jgi:DNA polymerase III epsilon subunit family exonuclease
VRFVRARQRGVERLAALGPDGRRLGLAPQWVEALAGANALSGWTYALEGGPLRPRVWLRAPLDPFAHEFVVVDTETNGLRASEDAMIEIGALRVRHGRIVDEFQTFVDAGHGVSPFVTTLTGITNEMIEGAPSPGQAIQAFARFAEGAVLLGHNVGFDRRFLQVAAARHHEELPSGQICTIAMGRSVAPDLPLSLGPLAEALGVPHPNAHRALADAHAAWQVFLALLERSRLVAPLHPVHQSGVLLHEV